eukprot:15462911-Alexandrium_andersonii.AAC.1
MADGDLWYATACTLDVRGARASAISKIKSRMTWGQAREARVTHEGWDGNKRAGANAAHAGDVAFAPYKELVDALVLRRQQLTNVVHRVLCVQTAVLLEASSRPNPFRKGQKVGTHVRCISPGVLPPIVDPTVEVPRFQRVSRGGRTSAWTVSLQHFVHETVWYRREVGCPWLVLLVVFEHRTSARVDAPPGRGQTEPHVRGILETFRKAFRR